MPDFSSARAAALPPFESTSNATVTAGSPATRLILRGTEAIGPAGEAFGLRIPTAPSSSASAGSHHALWLGPDEWLLLAPESESAALQAKLLAALAGVACALVDISHRQTALILKGPKAAAILSAGMPLDLSLVSFPVGMSTRTFFEKADIVLWRTGVETFGLEVWRSFAPYLLDMLRAADLDLP